MKIPRSVIIILLLWVVVFALAFIVPRFTAATGDSFTRGWNRIGLFFLWQCGAFILAVVSAVQAWTVLRSQKVMRWVSSIPMIIHLLMILLVVGVILFSRFNRPPPEAYYPPTKTPAVMAAPVAELAPPEVRRETKKYMGIYRSGFEMSHFYTMDGEGPWWLEAKDTDWERLQSFHVEGPGRSGGVTVALTMDAYLEEIGPGFNHLGAIDKKIHVESIDALRGLSREEFERVLTTIRPEQ